jgi:hypothetical protein
VKKGGLSPTEVANLAGLAHRHLYGGTPFPPMREAPATKNRFEDEDVRQMRAGRRVYTSLSRRGWIQKEGMKGSVKHAGAYDLSLIIDAIGDI